LLFNEKPTKYGEKYAGKAVSIYIIKEYTMNSSVIILKSITEANKAKRQLLSYRIKCVVEKVHARQRGCVYGIRINDDPYKICRLLSVVNVHCGEILWDEEQCR
jgi:hypothetical protein